MYKGPLPTMERVVPRYFFHLVHKGYRFPDEHGEEFASLASAWSSAIEIARQLVADHPATEDWSNCLFEITDEAQRPVMTVPFARVVPSKSAQPAGAFTRS